MRILCVAPAWNEGSRVVPVIQKVPSDTYDMTILVVDDGSTDETARLAREAGAIVHSFEQNRGVGAAIRYGINYAKEHNYDIVVVVSGGGKTPTYQIPSLVDPIIMGEADFVQGSRYVNGGVYVRMPMYRKIGTRGYSLLFSLFARRYSSDASSGFRAFRTIIFNSHNGINLEQDWLDRYELEPYLLYKALRSNQIKCKEVPVAIEYPNDNLGHTKMRILVDWWRIFRPVLFLALGIKS
jgi:dolichol-phosphate mannosyltransferase